ncbi:hypothetical protein [Asticcacaulis benevestitus]|uniref:Uncharacterized protein n=1 Tax=Asticcacaulis benevestitus DSM 16100 = ATCC BAA-896 TaxID=1121022 RepID=V4NUN1_9CAUL|nr:hypothetical protein [Asticcacaulis benevestitus]ESQ85537.1 hypothetical protein ABENE_18700 [Asticcacaulis benevestitus DSM 16100 = ATCC BAA-896]
MKKTLMTLAAIAATLTTVAAPAIATAAPRHATVIVVDDRGRGPARDHFGASAELNNRIDRLDSRIDQGRRTGALSAREGRRLDSELRNIIALKRGYERSGRGLNRDEVASLDNRLDRLQGQIRFEKRDGDNRRW